jgi:hypothetical protein
MVAVKLGRSWFLPQEDDVLGELCAQAEMANEAVGVAQSWAVGAREVGAAAVLLRDLRRAGEDRRRAVHASIRASFSTPLDAEDLFELAERLAELIDAAYALVREAELTETPPDEGLRGLVAAHVAICSQLLLALRRLPHPEAAGLVDEATPMFQEAEHAYRLAVVGLRGEPEIRTELCRRELYRRCEHVSGSLARVGRRTWYSVAKIG